MSWKTAEQAREYRMKNRERINANRRKRDAAMSPEKRAHRLAKKREWYYRTHPNAGVGKGNYKHKGGLDGMTADERAAHRAAMIAAWREANGDKMREYARRAYEKQKAKRPAEPKKPPRKLLTEAEKREHKRIGRILHRECNYQAALEREREAHRKHRDKTRKGEYEPVLSRRIPEWVENPAQARSLMLSGYERMMMDTKSVDYAIRCGLTVGRFSA